jgi:16S rRNA (cytosine1402-N4)-methyltransferase
MPLHVPIMPREMLDLLNPRAGQVVVDCTLGAGGHSRLLAKAVGPTGQVIALDHDPAMIALAKTQLDGLPVTTFHAGFDQLRDVLDSLHLTQVDAVFADLGVCSDQLDDAARGFTFQADGPLDMRLDPTRGVPASRLLATLPEREIADLIYQFGEERHSRRIARRIVEARQTQPLSTTQQLAELVRRCVPRGRERIDPATRTFQALRIAVNEELTALEMLLRTLPRCVRLGGRAAIMSFHSLEDRRVKQAFRERSTWEPLTKKPMTASEQEVQANPRSRSAKLRAAVRVNGAGGER